jgi:hypothetical protein
MVDIERAAEGTRRCILRSDTTIRDVQYIWEALEAKSEQYKEGTSLNNNVPKQCIE